MNDGLREDQRERLRALLDQFPLIARAWLFGSRSKGNVRPSSDIDLALESADGGVIELTLLLRLNSRVNDLNLPMEVDLVDRTAITDPAMLESIERDGVIWWEAEAAKTHSRYSSRTHHS